MQDINECPLQYTLRNRKEKQGGGFSVSFVSIYILIPVIIQGCFGFIDHQPPESNTVGKLTRITGKIEEYYAKNNLLPKGLADLSLKDDPYDNPRNDGWGNEFDFKMDNNEIILSSYGADKKPGGSGQDSDYVTRFKVDSDSKKLVSCVGPYGSRYPNRGEYGVELE